MAVSGNHDSGSRIDCFRSVLSRQGLYMVGRPAADRGGAHGEGGPSGRLRQREFLSASLCEAVHGESGWWEQTRRGTVCPTMRQSGG